MNIDLRHSTIKLTLVLGLLTGSFSMAQSEGPEGRQEPLVTSEVSKDKSSKTLRMKMEQGDDETNIEFTVDPKEITAISFLRYYLLDQRKEAEQQLKFAREFFSHVNNYKHLRLGKNEHDRQRLIKELQSDERVIDIYEKLKPSQRSLVFQAYRAKTYDPQAQRKFYARYMGFPENAPMKDVMAQYQKLPKHMQDEIARLYRVNHNGAGYRVYSSFIRPWSTALHGFPAQSALFSVAIGGVMMVKLMTDYAANPAALLQHLESLDDPIAHVSFYAFMAANGFTADYLTGKLGGMGGGGWRRSFRAAIPYVGMTSGMLASNLTHEVSMLVSACADRLLGKRDPKKEQEMMLMKMLDPKAKDPCDLAQEEFFNFENKVEQYIPMIISMSLSTAGSTVMQGLLVRVGNGIKHAADEFAMKHDAAMKAATGQTPRPLQTIHGATQYKHYAKVPINQLIKATKVTARASIRVTGFMLALRVTPAGWWFNSITVGAAVYSLAQNFAFVYLDTIMIPAISKMWAQFWRAGGVNNADKALKAALAHHEKNNWSELSKGCRIESITMSPEEMMMSRVEPLTYEVCDHEIVKHLEEFQKQMQAWRMQNHARFFTGVQIWTDILQKLIKEIDATEKFYTQYVSQLFTNWRIHQRKRFEDISNDLDALDLNYLPLRKSPLFGIDPLGHRECQEPAQLLSPSMMVAGAEADKQKAADPTCDDLLNLYTKQPDRLEGFQKNRLQAVVNNFGVVVGMTERALPYYEAPTPTGEEIFDEQLSEAAQSSKAEHDQLGKRKEFTLNTPEDRSAYEKAQKAVSDRLAELIKKNKKSDVQNLAYQLFREDGKFHAGVIKQNLKPGSLEFIKQIFTDFQSPNTTVIGEALNKLNKELQTNTLRDSVAQVFLSFVRQSLGSPTPKMSVGSALPVLYHEQNKDDQSYREFTKEVYGYKFERPVEYLLYQMICGPDSNTEPVITESKFRNTALLPPKFHPPRVIQNKNVYVKWKSLPAHVAFAKHQLSSPPETNLCVPVVSTAVPFSILYDSQVYLKKGDAPITFFEFLNNNIMTSILGDVRIANPNDRNAVAKIISRDNQSKVHSWWEQKIKSPLRILFKELDQRYQYLLVELVEGLQNDEKIQMVGPNQYRISKPWKRTEASRSLLHSNMEEISIYLRVLAALEKHNIAVNTKTQLKNDSSQTRVKGSLIAEFKNAGIQPQIASQDALVLAIRPIVESLQAAQIVQVEGQPRVEIPKQAGSLTEIRKQALLALKGYNTHLNGLANMTDYQKEIVKVAFVGLEKGVQSLATYLVNMQLANYDMIGKLEDYLKDHSIDSQNRANVNLMNSPMKGSKE